MARPTKFRLTPDDVLDPQNARKLAGHVAEIELWRKEIEKLQDNIAGVYDAADEDGFDNKFIRKLVALRSKDETTRQAEEHGVGCYSQALEIGFSSRARVENPEHDPETGEINEPEAAMLPQTGGLQSAPAASAGQVAVESPVTYSEPTTLPPLSVVAAASRNSAKPLPAAVPAGDRTKPHPDCRDPEECGVEASWNHMCLGCHQARAKRDAVAA